ncbi:MAG TPA: radical SAM protein [Candidatus Nanoarchaeia archaeon]|nr:radical SAM protein [Candidatus Nanoarchaeia archaeon]
MKNEVILIFPAKPGFIKEVRMPLMLLALAGVLEKEGFKVTIFDGRLKQKEALQLNNTIAVGISTTTGGQIVDSLDFAKYIREKDSTIPLIWGGMHPTMDPKGTAANEYVDVAVRGDGEFTFLELVQAFAKGRKVTNLGDIKGITWKNTEKDIITNPPREYTNLDLLGIAPYHLLDIDKYSYKELFNINATRGCPHRCTFCVLIDKWRAPSSEKLLDHVEYVINKFHPKKIGFPDANFFVGKQWAKQFMDEKIKRGIDIPWGTDCRLDYVAGYDDEYMSTMQKSNCYGLLFGAESGSQRILDLVKKDLKVEQTVIAIEKMAKYDLGAVCSFVVGNIGETKEETMQTLGLIDRLMRIHKKLDVNGIFIYNPWPGAPGFNDAMKHGVKLPTTLEGWGKFSMGTSYWENPFYSGRYKSWLRTLEMVSRLPFNPTDHYEPVTKNHQKFTFLREQLYKLLIADTRLRWKYKFFHFGFEYGLLNRYLNKYGTV